jgi:organic hydroperoxide reductase OsmC/OhrA
MLTEINFHFFEINLRWNSSSKGTAVHSLNIRQSQDPFVKTAELKSKEKWTPEHLFVAAVNSCLMSTFLLISENSKFPFISFESNALAKIEKIENDLFVTEIVIKPLLCIASVKHTSKAKRLLKMSERACTASKSYRTKITLEASVQIAQVE